MARPNAMQTVLASFVALNLGDQREFLKQAFESHKQAVDPNSIFDTSSAPSTSRASDVKMTDRPRRGRPAGTKNKAKQTTTQVTGAKRGRKPSNTGLASYILRVVRANANSEGMDAPAITDAVLAAGYKTKSKNPVSQVRTYLSDMASEDKGVLSTVKRGRYVIGSKAPATPTEAPVATEQPAAPSQAEQLAGAALASSAN